MIVPGTSNEISPFSVAIVTSDGKSFHNTSTSDRKGAATEGGPN